MIFNLLIEFFKKNIFLILIVVLASFLRFYELNIVPPSPSLDEASIGYNAYSIIKTGGDEYGYKLPLVLRAYDDFRPAMHVYTSIPFVWALGLNVNSVRLPVATLSVLTLIAFYFIIQELFKDNLLALVSSLILAISPWHIYISRLGHEVNEGLSFVIFGLLFFLKKRYNLSAVFFALSFMSYHPEKAFVPIIVLCLFILYRQELLKTKEKIIFASILGALLVLPFLFVTLSPQGLTRFSGSNIFSANQGVFYSESIKLAKAVKEKDLVGEVLHNRRAVGIKLVFDSYVSHFNPRWIFSNISGSDYHKAPNLGLFYIWEAPLMLIGFFALFFGKFDKRIKLLILVWILASPLTAAITTDAPHAMRSYTLLPMYVIFTGLGFMYLVKKTKAKKFLMILLLIITVFSLLAFSKDYFELFPKKESGSFQYALSQALSYAIKHQDRYKKIVVSNQEVLTQSYMFYLFSSKYDPSNYQKEGGTISGGFAKTHTIGKFSFRPIAIKKNNEITRPVFDKEQDVLYIGNIWEFYDNVGEVKRFSNLDGKEVIKLVER